MPSLSTRLWWALRVGAAACFIGHGAFGIITKAAWLPFFALFGIGSELAYALMPVVGTVDIIAGISILIRPMPVVMLYMTVWGVWTALLRPLTGDYFAEFLERAGNYGVPLALLLMTQRPRTIGAWIDRATPRVLDDVVVNRVASALVATTAVLLAGHGMLGVEGKQLLQRHWAAIGANDPLWIATMAGRMELAAAFFVVAFPSLRLAAGVLVWKLLTEMLFVVTGDPVWEFIERGGSYVAPLALVLIAAAYRLPGLRFQAIMKGRTPFPSGA